MFIRYTHYIVSLFLCLAPLLLEASRICVCMAIKDDEKVIAGCLESIKEIADCLCICDLGSRDRTLLLIEDFAEEQHIPVKLYPPEGLYTPTQGLKAARKTIRELYFSLAHTYLLLLDPSERVHVSKAFTKEDLSLNSYLLLEQQPTFSCYEYQRRLLRASLLWENVGTLYSSWSYKSNPSAAKLPTLSIAHAEEGLELEEKARRQIDALVAALAAEPDNGRYIFYLAGAYKFQKKYAEAITRYIETIAKSKEAEITWFAKCMLGDCYAELHSWEPALFWYLEAFQANPQRAEPLKRIATHYRLCRQNDLAYLFAKHGEKIRVDEEQLLYLAPPFLDYGLDEELSIVSYYTPFKNEGYEAVDRLILEKSTPSFIKERAYKNLLFYAKPLLSRHSQEIVLNLPLIRTDATETYHPMNPTILKTPSGYLVICRTVNYNQVGAKSSYTIAADGILRTKNFLLSYSDDFVLMDQREIIENLPREKYSAPGSWVNWVKGLDDARLFAFQDALWFTCTSGDTHECGNLQMCLCKLEPDAYEDTIQVEKLVPLQGPDPNRCEKNWLPFIQDDKLYAIYSYDPFTIFHLDEESGKCTQVLQYEPAYDFSQFRGSAAPIRFANGYLLMIHEVTYFEDGSRCYLHRFLYLDQDFRIEKLSKPFFFHHLGVEYCCGMTLDKEEQNLIICVGIEDREAYLFFTDIATVTAMLTPFSKP